MFVGFSGCDEYGTERSNVVSLIIIVVGGHGHAGGSVTIVRFGESFGVLVCKEALCRRIGFVIWML